MKMNDISHLEFITNSNYEVDSYKKAEKKITN